jgi:hypothetical protein
MRQVLVLVCCGLLAGCEFGGDDPCELVVCSGFGTCVAEEGGARCECEAGYRAEGLTCVREAGQAVTLETALESSSTHESRVNLRTNTVTDDGTDYDLRVFENPSLGGMAVALGTGVQGQSLGSATAFHSITEAPDTGYQADDAGAGVFVIGGGFAVSGNCEQGYVMSDNVYALKLGDDSYAKILVLSARQGVMKIQAFRQSDRSRDLTTAP